LCPVDFDANLADAVEQARGLAAAGKGKIWLFHVVAINPLAQEGLLVGELWESQIEAAREKLAKIAKERLEGIESQVVVEPGDPAGAILAMTEKTRADLVVMATHGRKGITRLVLGSVAERVVRESSAPVLTVRPRAPRASG